MEVRLRSIVTVRDYPGNPISSTIHLLESLTSATGHKKSAGMFSQRIEDPETVGSETQRVEVTILRRHGKGSTKKISARSIHKNDVKDHKEYSHISQLQEPLKPQATPQT
jgi:hypothetical protein